MIQVISVEGVATLTSHGLKVGRLCGLLSNGWIMRGEAEVFLGFLFSPCFSCCIQLVVGCVTIMIMMFTISGEPNPCHVEKGEGLSLHFLIFSLYYD